MGGCEVDLGGGGNFSVSKVTVLHQCFKFLMILRSWKCIHGILEKTRTFFFRMGAVQRPVEI